MPTNLIDFIATPEALRHAWRQVRANKGAAGGDQVTIQHYESDLEANLDHLALLLREERYYPMPLRRVQIPKADGGMRDLGIFTVEDRIVQRAVLDTIEPLFEPTFLDCSFGYRPHRSVQDAVARVEQLQRQGHEWVVDADIQNFFGSLNHHLLMGFVQETVQDRAVLRLIQMWLDAGLVGQEPLPRPLAAVVRFLEQGDDRLCAFLRAAADRMTGEPAWDNDTCGEMVAPEPHQTLKVLAQNWGKEAFFMVLANPGLLKRLLNAKSLVAGGSAILAVATMPKIGRAVARRRQAGIVQGGPISPLLANIYLHRFDQSMTAAGYHLVRFADDFVVPCTSKGRAEHALRIVRKNLDDLKLALHDQKTRVVSFAEGFPFLGHAFDNNGAYPLAEGWTLPRLIKGAKR